MSTLHTVRAALGLALLATALAACGDPMDDGPLPPRRDAGGARPQDAASDPSGDDDAYAPPPPTCPGGTRATLTGRALAPNGTDPVPDALLYVVANDARLAQVDPGVVCRRCGSPAGAVAEARSGPDGSFTLAGGALDAGGTFAFVVESGGFRHVVRDLHVTACTPLALTPAQTRLPGAPNGEDTLPRIAVGGSMPEEGLYDHFYTVLRAIGITAFDTFDPDVMVSGASSGRDLRALLSDMSMLSRYQIIAVPCGALDGEFASRQVTTTVVNNLRAWLAAGGRLYVSDLAYPVVDRVAPGVIQFANYPASYRDPADIGEEEPGAINAHVDDMSLLQWLRGVGVLSPSSDTVPVTGWLPGWAAIQSVPPTNPDAMGMPRASALVSGDVRWTEGTPGAQHRPLTVRVDYPNTRGEMCGQAVYSSYHVREGASDGALSPQERILEYLFFQLARCVEAPG